MSVIARDAAASDHLVYAWPFPIGPEDYEVACAEDERVVMCPAWTVGGLFGPGRHRWRTPDPTRPSAAYFVLTAPVAVSFDFTTLFQVPATGERVRVRAAGSIEVRCSDPGLLIAQFVGLPFDAVNDGILRSISRSAERMLARLLTRRVVVSGTALAVTDPQMLAAIVEELVAYNPAAGAVFGIELARVGRVSIAADDGSRPVDQMFAQMFAAAPVRKTPEPARTRRTHSDPTIQPPMHMGTEPGVVAARARSRASAANVASGEIVLPAAPTPTPMIEDETTLDEEVTHPSPTGTPSVGVPAAAPAARSVEAYGAILGIGVGHIGASADLGVGSSPGSTGIAGELSPKVAPGARVLVPGADGLMQSATVRQLLQGYYELEVGGSGETIWVPVTGVVPEP